MVLVRANSAGEKLWEKVRRWRTFSGVCVRGDACYCKSDKGIVADLRSPLAGRVRSRLVTRMRSLAHAVRTAWTSPARARCSQLSSTTR